MKQSVPSLSSLLLHIREMIRCNSVRGNLVNHLLHLIKEVDFNQDCMYNFSVLIVSNNEGDSLCFWK